MLDDFDLDVPEDEEDELDIFDEEGGEPGTNRNFMMIAGGLGVVLLISMICIAVYSFVIRPGQEPAVDPAAATMQAQQTELSQSLTETAQAIVQVLPSETLAPSATVEVLDGTGTATVDPSAQVTEPIVATQEPDGGATVNPATATVYAVLTKVAVARTQAAETLLTTTPTFTPTALPNTGFLDDYGPIGLFMMAAMMILVIFMSRRLRMANI
ncbi:MAG: hypothetical protein OEY93_01820 [Anaerolineae bacterium]|nr:hypothetical protein [Anaerolineae bacterium]